MPPSSFETEASTPAGLHDRVVSQLSRLYPDEPGAVLSFAATRLVSPERPYGYEGKWEPLRAAHNHDGGHNRSGIDGSERIAEMYAAVQQSYVLLDQEAPHEYGH